MGGCGSKDVTQTAVMEATGTGRSETPAKRQHFVVTNSQEPSTSVTQSKKSETRRPAKDDQWGTAPPEQLPWGVPRNKPPTPTNDPVDDMDEMLLESPSAPSRAVDVVPSVPVVNVTTRSQELPSDAVKPAPTTTSPRVATTSPRGGATVVTSSPSQAARKSMDTTPRGQSTAQRLSSTSQRRGSNFSSGGTGSTAKRSSVSTRNPTSPRQPSKPAIDVTRFRQANAQGTQQQQQQQQQRPPPQQQPAAPAPVVPVLDKTEEALLDEILSELD